MSNPIKLIFKILMSLYKFVTSRIFWIMVAFLFQLGFFAVTVILFRDRAFYFYIIEVIIHILVILYIINDDIEPSFKIAWLIAILFLPYLGSLFYFFFAGGNATRVFKRKINRVCEETRNILRTDDSKSEVFDEIRKDNPHFGGICRYLNRSGGFPVYRNAESKFFPIGEEYFAALKAELKRAEKFIFIESFIIHEGRMWDQILEILRERAEHGVEIKILYDDFGCFFTLSKKYTASLNQNGIECKAFNPITIMFNLIYNNRNHQKICVIDGKTAFTGGINFGDEYINEKERFGHWKDYGFMFRGEAVWSYTNAFLSLWDYSMGKTTDRYGYKPKLSKAEKGKGYIIPFTDSPIDDESISHDIFTNIIDRAEKYVYITTPYLILDTRLSSSLILAVKRGVDVVIMTPHIPDKKIVFQVTRGNYYNLIKNGVKIYEYTPGFLHAKSIIADDVIGVIGSINMDYRSLYLHFENGVILYKDSEILNIKKDHIKIISKSERQNNTKVNLPVKIFRSVLNVFAPLM